MNITKHLFSLTLISGLALGSSMSSALAGNVDRMVLETKPDRLGVERMANPGSSLPDVLPSEESRLVTETQPIRLGVDAPDFPRINAQQNRSSSFNNTTAETDPSVFGEEYSHNHL